MVLGLLFGIMGAWTIVEGAHILKGGMSSSESSKYDKKNGARGIDPKDVVKIAQRNGVYPNKHGVLPEEPNQRIMDYVMRYANSPADIAEFKHQWYIKVSEQLDKKQQQIKEECKSEYNKTRNYFETCIIPYLSNDTICIEISHWHFMPQEVHMQRMEEIVKKTVFGKLVKNYSLRINPHVDDCHVEYFELKIPKDNTISPYYFKELYKLCCAHLGYDHQL